MHDIWNPWHGCQKYSEGCQNCYMYFLDEKRGQKGSSIYKVKTKFDYPLQKRRDGSYKIEGGEMIRVCMTSDFFMEEADPWREEVWAMIRERSDVIFFILTKRAERIMDHLPDDWEDGYDNVFLNVTCENQQRARERIPILKKVPAKHKGIMCTPMLSAIEIQADLNEGWIEQVVCGGENYGGNRLCDFEWVKSLYAQCKEADVKFAFLETGTKFRKDGKVYTILKKGMQSHMAYKSGMCWPGKKIEWVLKDPLGMIIPPEDLYQPHFRSFCFQCGSQSICNGCGQCRVCHEGRTR